MVFWCGQGRKGDRLSCSPSYRTEPALLHPHNENTHPQTSCLHSGAFSFWASSSDAWLWAQMNDHSEDEKKRKEKKII